MADVKEWMRKAGEKAYDCFNEWLKDTLAARVPFPAHELKDRFAQIIANHEPAAAPREAGTPLSECPCLLKGKDGSFDHSEIVAEFRHPDGGSFKACANHVDGYGDNFEGWKRYPVSPPVRAEAPTKGDVVYECGHVVHDAKAPQDTIWHSETECYACAAQPGAGEQGRDALKYEPNDDGWLNQGFRVFRGDEIVADTFTERNAREIVEAASRAAALEQQVAAKDAEIAQLTGLIESARKLISCDGHKPTCPFSGCTCGAVEDYKNARCDFLRQLRTGRRFVIAQLKEELEKR